MITLYGIANCDTMKKTRQWLEQHDVPYHFHDYRKQGLDESLAREFVAHVDLAQLINKRGTTWRQLPESSKAALDAQSAVALMVSQPSLIKRPLLRNAQDWVVGFDTAAIQHLVSHDK